MSFSILIPTLNEEKYVGKLLDALVSQTYKDFEVIVVDGGSEDKTREVILGYANNLDLKLLDSSQRGVAFQRNFAAKNSHHEKLVFFDADVIVNSNFLEKLHKYISTHTVGVLTSTNIPLSNKLVDKLMYCFFFKVYCPVFARISPGVVGTFIYVTKEVFEDIGGFDEGLFIGEDMDLSKRIFKKGYKYMLLKEPPIYFSVRRLDEAGRCRFIWNNIKGFFYYHFKGGIKKEDADKFVFEWGKHK